MRKILKNISKYVLPRQMYEAFDGGLSIMRRATYKSDGMITLHNVDFLSDPRFKISFQKGLEDIPRDLVENVFESIRWRAHICCWAANQAINLKGDFVECGVWYGVLARTIAEYTQFQRFNKNFYLLDTFGNLGRSDRVEYEPDIYDVVKKRFSDFENVHLVRGHVPGTLSQVPSESIAYLSIDMNAVEPERHALNYFYQKMVPGGIIYFDDYGWAGHRDLKVMIDEFFNDKPESILYMPTGQGIVIKV